MQARSTTRSRVLSLRACAGSMWEDLYPNSWRDMAKKEARRAVRQSQQKKRPAGARHPTMRRSAIQGAILAVIYLVLVRFILNTEARSLEMDVSWAVIFFFMYSGLIYVWEKFLYNRRQRKQSENKQSADK